MSRRRPSTVKTECAVRYAKGERVATIAASLGIPRMTVQYWVCPESKACVLRHSARRYARLKPLVREKNRNWRIKNPLRDWAARACSRAKYRALQNSLSFDISPEYLLSLYPFDGKCPALGITLALQPGTKGAAPSSPALDRVNPLRGFVRGNVAVIPNRANAIKHNANSDAIRRVAIWLENLGLPF